MGVIFSKFKISGWFGPLHESLSIDSSTLATYSRLLAELGLLVGIALGQSGSCHLGKLLELLATIIETTQMICVLGNKIWFDRVDLANQIETANLLLKPTQNSLWIKDRVNILQKCYLRFIITRCIGSHRW